MAGRPISLHSFPTRRSSDLLREKFPEMRVDLKFDGYKIPAECLLIIIEGMQNNIESISKQREAMQTIYRRSEEHTSELQSRGHLVCRLLLVKKKILGRCAVR